MRIAAYLGLVSLESRYRAMAAAGDTMFGISSGGDETQQSLHSYFQNLDRGDTAYAELDAVLAAIEMTGGEAAAAVVAWGTFAIAGDAYVDVRCGDYSGN